MKLKITAIALSAMLLFCGCGEKKAEKNDNPSDNTVHHGSGEMRVEREYVSDEQAAMDSILINEMLNAFKNSEYEAAMKFVRESDRSLFDFGNESQSTLYDSIISQITFETGEDYYYSEKHYVDTKITAPDMLDIYGKINLEYIDAMLNGEISSEEESRKFNNEALQKIVAEGDFATKEMTVAIELQTEEGEERVVFTAELMNAMLGDIQNAQQQVSQAIEEGMSEYSSAKESGALD